MSPLVLILVLVLVLTHPNANANANGQTYHNKNWLDIWSLVFECRVEVIEVIYSYQYLIINPIGLTLGLLFANFSYLYQCMD